MLTDTFNELIQAIKDHDDKKKEQLYRRLEKAGMDRYTTNVILKELMKKD